MGIAARWVVMVMLVVGLLLGFAAGGAQADSHESAEIAVDTGASPDSPDPSDPAFPPDEPDRYPSLDVPIIPWAYDSSYYFALTRGLREAGVESDWARGCAMVGTVPMDIVTLPGAALAGLFGT